MPVFGGLELATTLSEAGGGEAFEVTVIDRRDAFVFGYSKLDVLFGRTTLDAVRLPYAAIAKPGVEILQETITAIDPQARRVTTDAGTHDADALVVALGADYDYDATPGLLDANEFYSVDGPPAWPTSCPTFTEGRALIGVCGAPYKCPPAPSECALLLHDYLAERGVRDACEITIVSPFGRPIPPSPDSSAALLEAFAEHGITLLGRACRGLGRQRTRRRDRRRRRGVPVRPVPRRSQAPGAGCRSRVGHGRGGLHPGRLGHAGVEVPRRLRGRRRGHGRRPQGRRLCRGRRADRGPGSDPPGAHGDAPGAYDGKGSCYIEFGGGRVGRVDIDFLSGPNKTGVLQPPSQALVAEKIEFGASRRARWGFEPAGTAAH